jgi:hypothetical protein
LVNRREGMWMDLGLLICAFADIAGTQRPIDLAYLITENETSPS